MAEAKYLVSICIPTYNRAPYLKQCLDSLVCQPEFLKGDVEIVISDNASTDDTCTLVMDYQKQYANITYHRNSYNVGCINGDINYAIAMQSGHGILRKLGGDIRIYKKGSLQYFCDISRKWSTSKPVIYFSNGYIRGNVQEMEEITTMDHFLECASFMLTWIDTFFLWDEECRDLVPFAENSRTGFWFVEKTIELMEQKKRVVFFNKKLIEYIPIKGKNVSYGIFDVFYNKFLGIFRALVNEQVITSERFNYLEKDLLFGFFMNSILAWELRHKYYVFSQKENLKEMVWNQYATRPYFKDFCRTYNKLYKKGKFRQRVKDIPILGMLLVKIKRMIMMKWGKGL